MKVKEQLKICQRYINKQRNAVESGILFALPLTSFHNIMRSKRCRITGKPIVNCGDGREWNYLTIDRVDRTKGYIKGNCIAIGQRINKIKGLIEDPNNDLSPDDLIKLAKFMEANK